MTQANDFRADRVVSALAGTNPTVLRRLRAGFAVIGDVQHLPGYCVLITDTPGADQLVDLPIADQEMLPADIVGWLAALHRWTRRAASATTIGPQHDDLRADLVAQIDAEIATIARTCP